MRAMARKVVLHSFPTQSCLCWLDLVASGVERGRRLILAQQISSDDTDTSCSVLPEDGGGGAIGGREGVRCFMRSLRRLTCHDRSGSAGKTGGLELRRRGLESRWQMSGEFALDTSPPSPATLAIAEKELRETPEVVAKALAELRELLKNDDTIYFKDDDQTLIMYLRPCKFYAESAYKLMKRIADFKESHKDILDNLLPEDEKTAFTEHNVVNVLKNRDHKGRRVLIVNVGGTWDPSKVTPTQLFRIFYLIHEVAVLEPETQINGCVVIMDFKELGMKQVKAFSPSFSLLLLSFIQDAMPLRLKEVHMVKQPFVFNIVWNIFKPFIKEKLKGRIHFHGSKMASLHKFMEPSHLPKDYDGELPMLDYGGKDWYPVVDKYIEHIKVMNSFGKKKQ